MIGFCLTPLETFSGMDIWLGHLTSFDILLPGLSLHLLPVFYLRWSSLGNRRTLSSAPSISFLYPEEHEGCVVVSGQFKFW